MFLLVPIKTDSRLRSVPWANWLIIAANVVVFILERESSIQVFRNWGLNSQRPELYQFITYAFMHDGPWHIAGNMLFLYIFGNNICDRLGSIAYLAFYLAGAIFSGIGYAALNQTGLVVGASGAVAAVTGAYLALLPRSHITLFYWVFILIGLYEIPSLWFIGMFFLQDLYYSFSRNTGVANIAHVSGSIFGFLVALLALKIRLLPRDHFDMLSLIDRWNRRRQYQEVVNRGYDPFGFTPPGNSGRAASANGDMERVQDMRAQIAESIAHGNLIEAAATYVQLRQIDPNQTLARGMQLDIANQLFASQDYANAAAAYELFRKSYAGSDQMGQVMLMLGLAYSRYLGQPDKARECLQEAVRRLPFDREQEIAKRELASLGVIAEQ